MIFQVHFHGIYYAGDHIDIHDNTSVNFYQGEHSRETTAHETCAEDVVPIDTFFFSTQQFTEDIIEKNLRQAITLASSKADACRRIMASETLGYVLLSNVTGKAKSGKTYLNSILMAAAGLEPASNGGLMQTLLINGRREYLLQRQQKLFDEVPVRLVLLAPL